MGNDTTMQVATGVTISTGPIELDNQNIVLLPVDYIARQAGYPTEGILSVGAFMHQVVQVDYTAKQVRFIDTAEFAPLSGAVEVPITIRGNVPFVKAEIDLPDGRGIKGTFLLDSGFVGTILFSRPFIARHPELLHNGRHIHVPSVEAVGGKMNIQAGRIASLRLGPFKFKQLVAIFSIDGAGILDNPQIDGIVGADMLKRFCVAYDYSHHRIFLTSGPSLNDPIPVDSSGLRLVVTPPDFHHFEVDGIVDRSPAAEAGVSRGDIVVAIDGKPAAALTLSQIREMLQVPNQEHLLSLEHNQKKTESATQDPITDLNLLEPCLPKPLNLYWQ